MTDRDALRDALAEVQHYSLTVEPDDSAYMELDRDGKYVLIEDVDAVVAARSEPAGLRDRLRKALVENGVDSTANLGLHSWRCEYYLDIAPEKGGGPCDCVDTLLDDLVSAATPTASPTATGEDTDD